MSINFDKYLNSKNTHWISNSGTDERGKSTGGQAGDQNGKEWQLKPWYNRPWTVVLRHPDPQVRRLIAELGIEAALNDKIGYDQYQRTTYWAQLQAAGYRPSNIKTACEEDCTAGVTANIKAVGYLLDLPKLQSISVDTYSGNMKSRFKSAGFQVLTGSAYTTGTAYLLPGDILLYEGHHAATNVTRGNKAQGDVADSTPAPVEPHVWRLGDRILKNGMEGEDVKDLQTMLIEAGYPCGTCGADGEFGDATEMAVRSFQAKAHLTVDGEAGPITINALREELKEPETPYHVHIVGGNCYIRDAPNTSGGILGVAYQGSSLQYISTEPNGWHKIDYQGVPAYVSGKYGRLI